MANLEGLIKIYTTTFYVGIGGESKDGHSCCDSLRVCPHFLYSGNVSQLLV